ncbi:hypothetical protein PIB30_103893, partial [Stylosanthes scabra]|nr:hypothetical protein [Stylosanthes scabra]
EKLRKEACRARNKDWKQNRGRTSRICVEDAYYSRTSPRLPQLWPRLSVAPWLPLTTH